MPTDRKRRKRKVREVWLHLETLLDTERLVQCSNPLQCISPEGASKWREVLPRRKGKK